MNTEMWCSEDGLLLGMVLEEMDDMAEKRISFVQIDIRKRLEISLQTINPIGNQMENTEKFLFPVMMSRNTVIDPYQAYGYTARLLNRLLKTAQERQMY